MRNTIIIFLLCFSFSFKMFGQVTTSLVEKDQHEYSPLLRISTNALYWAALAPNVGFEFFLPSNRISFNMEYLMPWWKNSRKDRYYQLLQGSIEPRFWLKDNGSYTGHFFGVYGNGGLYDLENGGTGYRGRFWGTGITYGYLLPIKKRFALEFSLGLGYLDITHDEYTPFEGHYVYEKTIRTGYWGPTKLKLGLIWTPKFFEK